MERREKMAITTDQSMKTAPLAQATDEELLMRYQRCGERRLFAELVRRYERELFNYLRRYLGDAELAEDVFQAAFLLVHLKCDQFEAGRKFRPWLYAVATNAAIDAQRRDKRHRAVSLDRLRGNPDSQAPRLSDLLVSDAADPLQQAARLENGQWVRQAMDELTEQMQSVIHLVYYQGMKYREAADVLGIPVGTVKSRLHAAIQKLQEHWHTTHTE